MKRKFSRLENVLLVLLTVIFLGLVYYQLVYRGLQDARTRYDTTDLDAELQVYQLQILKIQNMEGKVEESKKNIKGYVPTYNSQKQEIRELNDIFADAISYDFSFDGPVASGDTVRRNFTVTFVADDYKTARKIITNLQNGKYRCQLGSISMTPTAVAAVQGKDWQTLDLAGVSVSMSITFYETLYDAKSTKGVTIENADTSGDESVLNQLADEKATYESMGN